MDNVTRGVSEAEIANLDDPCVGPVTEQLVGQFVDDHTWKGDPCYDESGDNHVFGWAMLEFSGSSMTRLVSGARID
jgi:hypothetical protein